MAEEKQKKLIEKPAVKQAKEEAKKPAEAKKEIKPEAAKSAEMPKTEAKKTEIKVEEKKKQKKKEAVARGLDLGTGKKHCMAICDFIRGRSIQNAIKDLEQVVKLKKAIPMKGEIPHRRNIGPGRYPVNASKIMIKLLKGLDANARVLDIQNPVITMAMANKASEPFRRFGSRRFKRTHVLLIAKEAKEAKKK